MSQLIIVAVALLALVLAVSLGKINAFIAFLVISLITGLALGMNASALLGAIYKGLGDTIGGVAIIIILGSMLGKLVAVSGAAEKIASSLTAVAGERYIQWALLLAGFIIGLPLFYNVGFILVIPMVFSVIRAYRLPPMMIALPMIAPLSVAHGFLPPHPSPVALARQLHAETGHVLLYGLIISVPLVVIAGVWFSRTCRQIAVHTDAFKIADNPTRQRAPGFLNSLCSALLPVVLIAIASFVVPHMAPSAFAKVLGFAGEPSVAMILAIVTATISLGVGTGMKITEVMKTYESAAKDMSMLLLIIGGSGILKQVLYESGVSDLIARTFGGSALHPLAAAWLLAAILRVCLGSATIAGLTAAGLIGPLAAISHTDPALMVLSIGAGSLFFSHVNDSGFWLFKESFGLTVKQTFRTWSIMETIASVGGLAGVFLVNAFLN